MQSEFFKAKGMLTVMVDGVQQKVPATGGHYAARFIRPEGKRISIPLPIMFEENLNSYVPNAKYAKSQEKDRLG